MQLEGFFEGKKIQVQVDEVSSASSESLESQGGITVDE